MAFTAKWETESTTKSKSDSSKESDKDKGGQKSKPKPVELSTDTKKASVEVSAVKAKTPDVQDAIAKAKAAVVAARKLKQRQVRTHYCTECGREGIQLYDSRSGGRGHFYCGVDEDGNLVNTDGSELTDPHQIRAAKQVKATGHVD